MKRWYQRQWWYIEKPMPWAMIVLWPFLWVVGTVDELRRRFSKPTYSVEPGLTIDFNGVTLPWNATARDIHDATDTPTIEWEFPDPPFLTAFEWHDKLAAWEDRLEADGYTYYTDLCGNKVWTNRIPPIVDRDYE